MIFKVNAYHFMGKKNTFSYPDFFSLHVQMLDEDKVRRVNYEKVCLHYTATSYLACFSSPAFTSPSTTPSAAYASFKATLNHEGRQ